MKLSNKMQTIIGYIIFGLGLTITLGLILFAATMEKI